MEGRISRLGVLGGTFDPVHRGHLHIAAEAADRLGLDRVVFVPAGRPWQRSGYSHPEDRYMMAVLAAGTDPRFAVSRIELDRRGPSYTADTMRALRDFYGDQVQMYFIAGADAVANLHTWKKLDEFISLSDIIAVSRPGHPLVLDTEGARVHILELEGLDVSGSQVRRTIARGGSVEEMVSPEVSAFIRERGLYRGLEEAI